MEANASSANWGLYGERLRVGDSAAKASTRTPDECNAVAQASKKHQAAEKKKKTAQRVRKLREKNPKKKGGTARKSAIKQRKNRRQLLTTGTVGGESPTRANTTARNNR